VKGGLADIWKENVMEDLESEILSYVAVAEFLSDFERRIW